MTFSCDKCRKRPQHDQAKKIVIDTMGSRLAQQQGFCLGFVIMQDHVQSLIWFPETWKLSPSTNKWKELTSKSLETLLPQRFQSDSSQIDSTEPSWQTCDYGFNIRSQAKVEEKLDDMHRNPVRARLVDRAGDWPWRMARRYFEQIFVGKPIRGRLGSEADDQFTRICNDQPTIIASCASGTRPPSKGGRTTQRLVQARDPHSTGTHESVARSIKERLANVVSYCTHRITNGADEGMSSKIMSIKRRVDGFRNRQNFKTAIFFYCGGLKLDPQ